MKEYTQAELQQGRATEIQMRRDALTEYTINGFCVILVIATFIGAILL